MTVTAVNLKVKFIPDSDLLLCARFWSKLHCCDRKVESDFLFHLLILLTPDISSQVQYWSVRWESSRPLLSSTLSFLYRLFLGRNQIAKSRCSVVFWSCGSDDCVLWTLIRRSTIADSHRCRELLTNCYRGHWLLTNVPGTLLFYILNPWWSMSCWYVVVRHAILNNWLMECWKLAELDVQTDYYT